MRLAHLLVLHGPHLDLLGEGKLSNQPKLEVVNRAIELAASTGVAGVRHAQGNSEAELVAALHRDRDWATHILINPGALAPTAYVLREALALLELPYAEVFVEGFPGMEEHAKKSQLRDGAELQKRGVAPAVYVDAAEKLLKAKFTRVPLSAAKLEPLARTAPPPPSRPRVEKELGRASSKNEVAAPARVAKTVGRAAKPVGGQLPSGISRNVVRQQIANRLSGRITQGELASWGRDQWLAVEGGAATESGQREMLSEALQALALSAAHSGAMTEPELLEWMARMG